MDYKNLENLPEVLKHYDVLIVGNCTDIDTRSRYLKELFEADSRKVFKFHTPILDDEARGGLRVFLDEEEYPVKPSSSLIKNFANKKILIDMTCFDMQDLTYLIYMLCEQNREFDISYVEPKEYKKKDEEDYEFSASGEHILSYEGNGLNYLPPFITRFPSKSAVYVLSLGFEPYRLAGFMSSDEINVNSDKAFVLGLPAFGIGWERKTLNANYLHMKSDTPNIQIVPADDPIQTYLKVEEIYKSLDLSSQFLNLFPIGTKPQTLGMIWFAVEQKLIEKKNDVGLLYDFVQKIPNRTVDIRNVHIWGFAH